MNTKVNAIRNDYIDYLKGILILLVVFGHSIQFILYKNSEGFLGNPVFKFIYMFHMPLFMAISGFVSYRSINNKTLFKSVSDRFKQLIIPIICWATLHNSVLLFVSINSNNVNMEYTLLSFLKSIIIEMIAWFWFLWSLFLASSIVSLLRAAKIDSPIFFLLLSSLLLAIPDIITFHMFKYTFPFFWLGYCVSKSNKIAFPLTHGPFAIFIWLLLSLICFMIWDNDTYIYISKMKLSSDNLVNIFFRYISGLIVSITFLILTSIIYRFARSQLISKFGKSTLSIYILQTYFFVVIVNIVPVFENRIMLSFVVAPFIAILVSYILYFFARSLCKYSIPRMLLFGRYTNRML